MSQANIPNITPTISITLEESLTLLLASIALEELALAHVVNAEAEKLQYVIGTLEPGIAHPVTVSNLIAINESVRKTLQDVIKKEMLLQFKLDSVINHKKGYE